MGHMERLLSLWIEEQKRQNLPISTLLIQDKARRLFVQLQHEQGSGTQAETFGASNGWFARFKARNNVLLTDEPAVADTQAAAHYPPVLRTILEEGCYSPHQMRVSCSWHVLSHFPCHPYLFWLPQPLSSQCQSTLAHCDC
uniref:HTH CENPB-type domain-containing protein n=1 Tax=Panthera leo TaxID=9689 RepID=A0A8C8XZA5_PANLE